MTARLAIITGMSGAGRTTAAKVLEDIGYFVIDNLPPALFERVVDLATAPGSAVESVALVVDVRGRRFSEDEADLHATFSTLRGRVDTRVLFLEASDDALVRRYEAARRAHPLAGRDRVVDGIARERVMLASLRGEADLVIDTTDVNVHELRERLADTFSTDSDAGLVVNVVTFGFKHGTPRDADLLFDVRFLPNPHWVEELRPLTGLDAAVRDYVLGQPQAQEFVARLESLLDVMIPGFVKEGKRYLTVGIACTGGRHRAVVLGEEVARHIASLGVGVQVEHRDRERE